VVQNFPLELGLDGEFQILEAAAARRERRRVLRRMFTAAGEPDATQREFIEAFKRATFGVEEKRLAGVLDGFLDEHGETFWRRRTPSSGGIRRGSGRLGVRGWRRWRGARRRRGPWAPSSARLDLSEKQRVRVGDFLRRWRSGRRGQGCRSRWSIFWPIRSPHGRSWQRSRWSGKVALPETTRVALRAVVEGIAGAELRRRLEMTRGIFAVLRSYEQSYDAAVRRAGRLTFAEVLRRLLPSAGAPLLAGESGAEADAEAARLMIDWRLDAKFDHWLLDEFQDTEFRAVERWGNLIDRGGAGCGRAAEFLLRGRR